LPVKYKSTLRDLKSVKNPRFSEM